MNVDLDKIPTSNLNLVLESDASQEAVIIAAQSADCTVVRGPPGTGKSQAIVNLIANALANQKKILVVCQKRAALDVVYQSSIKLDSLHMLLYCTMRQVTEQSFTNNLANCSTMVQHHLILAVNG